MENTPPTIASARDVAYAYLQGEVVGGRLTPGAVIDEAAIAEILGVSRTPVREALIQLERDGMVSAPPRRRPKVADAAAGDLELVLAPLGVLQAFAAEVAAPLATDADVAAMRAHNDRLLAATADGDLADAREADMAFHRVLVERAGNRHLATAVNTFELHVRRLSALYLRNRGSDTHSVREHEEIIGAVARRDAGRAAAVTRSNYLRRRPAPELL